VINISVCHKAVVARAAAKRKQRTQKWLWLLMNILTRTMNTLSGLWILSINGAVWLSCSKLHTRLQSVVLSHLV